MCVGKILSFLSNINFTFACKLRKKMLNGLFENKSLSPKGKVNNNHVDRLIRLFDPIYFPETPLLLYILYIFLLSNFRITIKRIP